MAGISVRVTRARGRGSASRQARRRESFVLFCFFFRRPERKLTVPTRRFTFPAVKEASEPCARPCRSALAGDTPPPLARLASCHRARAPRTGRSRRRAAEMPVRIAPEPSHQMRRAGGRVSPELCGAGQRASSRAVTLWCAWYVCHVMQCGGHRPAPRQGRSPFPLSLSTTFIPVLYLSFHLNSPLLNF